MVSMIRRYQYSLLNMLSRQVFCSFILFFYTPKKSFKQLILIIKIAEPQLDSSHGLA